MSRTYSKPMRTMPEPDCSKHPGIKAVKGTKFCASCLHYQKLAPKVMGTEPKPTK